MNKIISLQELTRYDGDLGNRMYIAYRGIVYDVTDCPKWRTGMHENQHFPGQELSMELDLDAPHQQEVFEHPCVKRVGILSV
jgi:predicted heme/steroid binding protein